MLTRASLRYYAGTNALVVLGVTVAVAVLAGALLVGESVRESLRELAIGRLGKADAVVTSPTFFRSALAADIAARTSEPAVAMILAQGAVSGDESKRSAGRVAVYGIDDPFFIFHGHQSFPSLTSRGAFISEALARELGAKAGDSITLRIAKPTDIPLATLQGRKDVTGQRIRLQVERVLDRSSMGEFSLTPSQGPVLAIYTRLDRLQRDLNLADRVNTVLLSLGDHYDDLVAELVAPVTTVDDLGLRLRTGRDGNTIVETRAGVLSDQLADGIRSIAGDNGLRSESVLVYVANTIRIRDRELPYSVVAAKGAGRGEIRLNQWAADDLKATVGDKVSLDYYLWSDEDGLQTSTAEFTLAAILPMNGDGADQTLTPDFPGISDAADISSWDPPFPVDLKRVRAKDEDYWDTYRAAPKAIISLEDGQRLWGSRYGKVSSIRLSGVATINPQAFDPAATGFTARDVRSEALAAAEGTTDFGEYFLYFSFFLVVAALLLAYLFFAVGLEQRTTEVGVLASLGFSPPAIRRLFIREAVILSAIGAAIGVIIAIGYSALILYGLRTWWIGAVNTTDLTLHIAPQWLAAGAIGALIVALAALWFGVRGMSRRSARSLLKGDAAGVTARASTMTTGVCVLVAIAGAALLAAALTGAIDPTAGFFGAGGAWLVAALCGASILLRRRHSSSLIKRGLWGMFALGIRHTSVRPARSVLSLALIAFASFVLVSIGAFKKDVSATANEPQSGTGGYALMGESVAPMMHDPNTPDGRDGLGLETHDAIISNLTITRFRLRPGDEASCLTLYRPTNPRIIAPESRFYDRPRFTFASAMASTAEEHANPWLLLKKRFDDDAIPAIADQTTLMYSLHMGVGDDFTFAPDGHSPVRLRIVGALADSVLQSELIIGEDAFVKLFPRHEGYRVWMIETAPGQEAAATTHLEDRLSDYGLDLIDTHQRWASYHQVENTYLATFQALGSLGLLLGTIGLGAVLARNILERRRELGLLRAIGFSAGDVRRMVLSEGVALVAGGLVIGAGCAIVAIVPALRDRAQSLPLANLAGLIAAVLLTGVIASLLAIRLTSRPSITTAIKSE